LGVAPGQLRRPAIHTEAGPIDESGRIAENTESVICGPVAQLGARFHGMEEVIGSIPIRSTKASPSKSSTSAKKISTG
jgi:hypothetical protein